MPSHLLAFFETKTLQNILDYLTLVAIMSLLAILLISATPTSTPEYLEIHIRTFFSGAIATVSMCFIRKRALFGDSLKGEKGALSRLETNIYVLGAGVFFLYVSLPKGWAIYQDTASYSAEFAKLQFLYIQLGGYMLAASALVIAAFFYRLYRQNTS